MMAAQSEASRLSKIRTSAFLCRPGFWCPVLAPQTPAHLEGTKILTPMTSSRPSSKTKSQTTVVVQWSQVT